MFIHVLIYVGVFIKPFLLDKDIYLNALLSWKHWYVYQEFVWNFKYIFYHVMDLRMLNLIKGYLIKYFYLFYERVSSLILKKAAFNEYFILLKTVFCCIS